MIKYKSISFKLIAYTLISCSVIFMGIFWYDYLFSKRLIAENIHENAKNLTHATVNEIDAELFGFQDITDNIAFLIERIDCNKDELLDMIRSTVEANPDICSATIAFEPHAFDPKLLYFAPCYARVKDALKLEMLGSESYQYFHFDWYKPPKELGKSVWTEPYYDEIDGILMASYSVPFYRKVNGERKFRGVVVVDIPLEWLQKRIAKIKIAKSGYGFLISKKGTYITHPLKELIMKETIFMAAEETGNKQYLNAGRSMTKGGSDIIPYFSRVTKKPSWLSYAPLLSSGWSLGIVFSDDELFSDINRLTRKVLMLGFLGLGILFIILFFIATSITRPLEILTEAMRGIGKGKLDFELPGITNKDEVGVLAESFSYMRDSLKKYIKELTETTAVKERMQSELTIAHDIQMGILPKIFPPFPDRHEFDIYAMLEPAKEVGGDFYDFFFMNNERLFFVVGDVSDKGVPAAILMAVTKTMIKAIAKAAAAPDEILDKVNKEIARDNDSCMFITVFCGILNIKTGEVLYSNGGHLPPLIIHPGEGAEFLKGDTGIAVGASEEAAYICNKILLRPADIICMYTDGFTEAADKKDELFGEQRLKEKICAVSQRPIKEIVLEAHAKVYEFSQGMPNRDDMTMLALQYFGNDKIIDEKTFVIKNSAPEISRLIETVHIFAKSKKWAEKTVSQITLALEEVLVNIRSYAYTDKEAHEITVILSAGTAEFAAKIIDDGMAFNPLESKKPDITESLDARKVGGLGIFLVRNVMDGVEYKRENGKNILLLKKIIRK